MNKLFFCGFMDYEDGKIARVTTTGEYEIPFNVFIDNAYDVIETEPGPCSITIKALGENISIFTSEEEYRASGAELAVVSMIPIGTFSLNSEDGQFEQSPHILFTGKVVDVITNPDAGEDGLNYCLLIETLGISFYLYIRHDAQIEKGHIVHGVAWLCGDLAPDDTARA